jgi:hypothetical protein
VKESEFGRYQNISPHARGAHRDRLIQGFKRAIFIAQSGKDECFRRRAGREFRNSQGLSSTAGVYVNKSVGCCI